jgi:hypothetical protein
MRQTIAGQKLARQPFPPALLCQICKDCGFVPVMPKWSALFLDSRINAGSHIEIMGGAMRGTARDKAVLQFVCGALSGEQGGFYFHPSDKDPSLGTSVDEKATYLMCLRSTAIGEPREGKSAIGVRCAIPS